MSSEEEEKRDKLIYEIVIDRYRQEWGRTQDLDKKASSVTGFAGLLATLTAGITRLLPESQYNFFLFIPLALFIVSALFGLFGYWIMKWNTVDPKNLIQRYADRSKEEVLKTYAASAVEWTQLNFISNQRKVKWIYRAFALLVSAIMLFFIITIVIVAA